MEQFKRTQMIIGKENMEKLQNSSILLVGVGGVGGYIAEFLVRSGIGNITIADFDVVDVTNLNRQIISLNSTLNLPKVDVLKNRLLDINKHVNICSINQKINKNNVESVLMSNKFDYVIDAIDILEDKIALIITAKRLGLNIISAMGTGNKIGIPNFEITDIYKTNYDALAKVVRKKLRENNIENLEVCFSRDPATELQEVAGNTRNIGSIVYYPAMCASVISAHIINKLIAN